MHLVRDAQPNDAIARRLRELGFVPGESLRLVTHAPFGGDPLLVKVANYAGVTVERKGSGVRCHSAFWRGCAALSPRAKCGSTASVASYTGV